ncbi:MAG: hypothetical protein ACLFR1_14735 [Spirochaetia bacterium]
MDPSVKQMLEGFSYAIKNYTSSLGPENPKIKEAKKLYNSLIEKAESGADITAISVDPNFSRMGQLVGELASEPALSDEELAKYGEEIQNDAIPAASLPAAGYHMARDQLDGPTQVKMKKYYDRIFEIEEKAENAIFFNAMLVEDGVLLEMSREPLIEEANKALEKAKEAYSPTVNYQQQHAVQTYSNVKTVAELEFEGTKMAEMSNVEHEWDALFLEVIGLLPSCAQAIEAYGPTDENVKKLKNSYRFMAETMGITWEDVFSNDRYLYFWENVLWKRVPFAKKAMYRVTSAKGYADFLKKKYFDPFIKDEEVPEKNPEQKVLFWGKEYDAQNVMKLLAGPPRPKVFPEHGK